MAADYAVADRFYPPEIFADSKGEMHWGTYKDTWRMALSIPAGQHELVVRVFRFPTVWAKPWKPIIVPLARAHP